MNTKAFFQMYFSLKFNVWLEWKDGRLTFLNLKENPFKNEISEKVIKRLWRPKLVFVNSNSKATEKQILQYNPYSSVLMLIRDGPGSEAPLSQWDEAKVYSSNMTKLLWRSLHFMSFTCNFDMFYFPFDSQTCFAQVSNNQVRIIQSKAKLLN